MNQLKTVRVRLFSTVVINVKKEKKGKILNLSNFFFHYIIVFFPFSQFHRVVIPPDLESRQKERQSMIYFPLTADDFEFRCLDGSDTYEPVTLYNYAVKNVLEGSYTDV